ncbi:MAG: hypothetical protein HOC70_05885 [Gammaproteobacteria bacterium]|nr:hypothetical protein [Gammaproteobacteria bacterium]MBT7370073.1 hypothetical protein [Gammaproteobacteria bacterium]
MSYAEIARQLRPDIEAISEKAEADCRVPPDIIDKLNGAGLLAMTIAEKYGGLELDALDSLKAIEELSYADSGVGWCCMIYSTTAHLGSFLPEAWGNQVYGVENTNGRFRSPISAGAAAPTGKGRAVEGGVIVSGRWAWGSGTHHCDWICGGTVVEEDGELRRLPNGEPAVHVMFFEKDQVNLQDNWNPSGLRGTGSVDFEVEQQFVPDGRWTVLGMSRRQIDVPLFRFPFFGYFASAVAMVPLGIARRAVDDFDAIAKGKVPAAKTSTINESSITQLEFGQAESLVEGAHSYLYSKVAELWEKVASGDKVTLEDKRQLRLAVSQATIMCARAVDKLYNAAGGTALQGHCSLQRHFRDIHAATQHRMVSPEVLRLAAAARLTENESGAQL